MKFLGWYLISWIATEDGHDDSVTQTRKTDMNHDGLKTLEEDRISEIVRKSKDVRSSNVSGLPVVTTNAST